MEEIQCQPEELLYHQRNDPYFQDIIQNCESNNNIDQTGEFELSDHILYKRSRNGSQLLVIPDSLVEPVLEFYHSNNHMVHLSDKRLYQMLHLRFFWPNMHRDCVDWTAACLTCKKIKTNKPFSHGLLEPIKAERPFQILGIDIKGPLTPSKNGYRYILVIVDHFTSWVEAAPLKGITAKEVISVFFQLIIARHGCPESLLSDAGRQFISELCQTMCKAFNIEKLETTPYHQQANGKTEKFIKFLSDSLATVVNKSHSN